MLCATFLDEDGVYDPAHFNDRLLLGLKGTMSEAELHVLRARLQGGILNKARRGELEMRPPVGLVYNSDGCARARPRSAGAALPAVAVRHLRPHRLGLRHGQGGAAASTWHSRTLRQGRAQGRIDVGRTRSQPSAARAAQPQICRRLRLWALPYAAGASMARTRLQRMPRDEWVTLIPGAHAGYISWDEYERNQRRLHESAQAMGADRRRGPRARRTRIAARAGAVRALRTCA